MTIYRLPLLAILIATTFNAHSQEVLEINDDEYLEMTGLNVMLAHDFYPESHQGGVGVIQNGLRVATNGDVRLEPAPGQWQPVPKVGKRIVNRATKEISVRMEYPDPDKNRKGFNPIIYPELNLAYTLKIKPEGQSFRIIVDLDKPLPDEWVGKVGFNFELFPGILFGKSFYAGERSGIFPRQANGPMYRDRDGEIQIVALGQGSRLTIAPEDDRQRMIIENVNGDNLELIDGRGRHNNGWFVVRSLIRKGATERAVEWLVSPHAIPGWRHQPVVQVSQVGYHPSQKKIAVIELDRKDTGRLNATLFHVGENGELEPALEAVPKTWGKFLRYQYLHFDFSSVKRPGAYVVRYGNYQTEPFQIKEDIYKRHVWQPTLEYFLPAQMCHMRINERYRVWHGACHLDDARMAPLGINHFDGYVQGNDALQDKYRPGNRVPGLDQGGWHDAGDFDLRIESQAETIHMLSLIRELFGVEYDNTSIDQQTRVVEIQQPDGKDDISSRLNTARCRSWPATGHLAGFTAASSARRCASMCFSETRST